MKITEPLNVLIIERDVNYVEEVSTALRQCNSYAGNPLIKKIYSN